MYMFYSPHKQLVFWRKRRRKISFKTSSFSVIIFFLPFISSLGTLKFPKKLPMKNMMMIPSPNWSSNSILDSIATPNKLFGIQLASLSDSSRYAYDGLPLLPCQPPTKIQPPRCKCGGQRVFECQILSSVISLFHIDDEDVYKQRTVMYKLVWYECPNLQPIRSPQVKIHGLLLSVVVLLWK